MNYGGENDNLIKTDSWSSCKCPLATLQSNSYLRYESSAVLLIIENFPREGGMKNAFPSSLMQRFPAPRFFTFRRNLNENIKFLNMNIKLETGQPGDPQANSIADPYKQKRHKLLS